MTSRIQQALSLPTVTTEMVEIKTFGLTEGLKQLCDVVSLSIITRDGRTLRITAFIVPHICDAVGSQPSGAIMR